MSKKKKVHPWDFYNLTDEQRDHAFSIMVDNEYAQKAIDRNDPFICYLMDRSLQSKLMLWSENNCNILMTKLKDPNP